MVAQPLSPMLATLGSASDVFADEDGGEVGDEWAFEMKWDGIRAIAVVSGGEARFFTRNGIDVTASYPDLASLPEQVDGDAVLDGEIVALNKAGRPDFGLLQRRMKLTKRADVDPAAQATPVQYMVFDIVGSGGKRVTGKSYDDRRELLANVVSERGRIHVPPAFDGDLDAAFAASKALDLEGVMAKRRDSTYVVGKRSRAWIKIKHHRTQEVIIGGWRPGKGRRASMVGSLLMGVPEDGELRYVGRVGSGFGERELGELTARLERLERKTSPLGDVPRADASDAHWISPTLVGEVEFSEWTSGNRLRQPTWRGWRPDKSPADVVREG
jgi:bifunctional non-homologous end joining protein LigD